ncbi:hypothetical protein HHI36_011972 [Cryptolaemus montrouzieri]|uniref:CHK kinase-like domain-containing protein n=1 Tax=Cryptolaemus montrouzieri TaxID=559131 RepID=A0ABD2NCW6_9CUCU
MDNLELLNISELLEKHFKEKIEIEKQHVKILTGPGEHYGSIILKVDLNVKIEGIPRELKLVAKQIPVSELLQKAFDVQVTFRKESFAYTVSLPTLLEFQKEFKVPSEDLLDMFPKCYGARCNLDGNDGNVDRNAAILFENLINVGYQTIDRLVGFDLEGAKVVVTNLAKFHAVPLALKLLRPKVFAEKVMPGLVRHLGAEQLGEEVISVFHNSIMIAARKCDELSPYLSRLQKLVDYYAKHPYTNRPDPSEEYGTISHCDVWTSNIMVLKDSNGVVQKNKFLDLQLTNYSSALRDLIFFLFTSVQNNFVVQNLDELIKLYYDNFVHTLKYFDIDMSPYSWDNFNKELNKIAPDEVYHVLLMFKIICSQRGKVTNTIDKFEITDWTRKDLLGEEHTRKMRDTVLALVSRNWL